MMIRRVFSGMYMLLLLATGALAQDAPATEATGVLQFNPLGLLQVGPNVEVQRQLSPGFAMGVGVRVISFGLLTHVMIDDMRFAWTGTVNAVLYPRKNLTGWFYGPRLEIGKSDREHYTSDLLGGALEFGYRRVRPNGFTFSLGAQAGALRANYTHKTDPSDTGRELYMFAMGVIYVGRAF